jgi:hypothetical protein
MAPAVGETCFPTGSLVVTAEIDQTVQHTTFSGTSFVTYIIHSSADGTSLKTTRYSELDALHTSLVKEVPGFRGRLPAKSFRGAFRESRRTSADFVESRRAAIEAYLRLAAADDLVCESNAWTSFFPDCDAPSTSSSAIKASIEESLVMQEGVIMQVSAIAEASEEEAAEDDACAPDDSFATVNDEMKTLLTRRHAELKEAEKKMK